MKMRTDKVKFSTEKRIIIYSIILFLCYAFLLMFFLLNDQTLQQKGNSPFGVDFGAFYTAGRMTLSGDAEQIFNDRVHHQMLEQLMNRLFSFALPWFYPPIFLLIVVPFSFLPYQAALILWLVLTLAFALYAFYRMLPNKKWLAVLMLGFPGVFMNLRWGQNGFLSVALIGLGIAFLESNPVLSGVMIGFLAYKPQFAFLPFVVLLLTKKWRAVIAAVLSAVTIALVSVLLFGAEVWAQFLQSFFHSSSTLFSTEFDALAAIQTAPFTSLLIVGVNSTISSVIQGVITVVVILVVRWVWKNTNRTSLKGAVLVLGIPLSIPYFMQYDLVILALPLVLLVYDFFENGCSKADLALTVALWFLPLLNWPLVVFTHVQICPIVLAAVMAMILLRVKTNQRVLNSKMSPTLSENKGANKSE